MNSDATPDSRQDRVQPPLESPPNVQPDLEVVLLEGLSNGSSSSEESGVADLLEAVDTWQHAVRAPETSAEEAEADFEALLLAGLSGVAPISSEDPDQANPREEARSSTGSNERDPTSDATPERSEPDEETVFDLRDAPVEGPSNGAGPLMFTDAFPPKTTGETLRLGSDATDPGIADDFVLATEPPETRGEPEVPVRGDSMESGIEAGPEIAASEGAPEGPVAALAFASDPETEDTLRQGLLHFEGPTSDCDDPQVWPGGLRAAVAALAAGHSSALVIVDVDGIAYPSGAIHELAEVCEVGTAVIAVGSNDTARFSREILLAGVNEYLVKPLTVEKVREATGRVFAFRADAPATGRVAGFAGTGGSGATTLAVATALHAAETGRYVSVLDLNRTVPVTALLLDVQPAAGLEQLIEVAGKAPPESKMVNGVRAQRSERISVYGYRWAPVLPAAPGIPALAWLLGELRGRSQLVLVDGIDDPRTQFALLSEVDIPVLVAEPTARGAARATRMVQLLEGCRPAVAVQNHTRAFRTDAGARSLIDAGMETGPDIVVPYLPSLPEIADRGWPGDRLPRRLRKPVAELLDRIVASDRVERPAPVEPRREAA